MCNEPNILFWKPDPPATHYIALARAVGQAIRQVAPNESYVGPATASIDFKFLEACFQAGLLEYRTGVTVQPYRPGAPETVLPEFARLRALIDLHAPPGKRIPILSGQWG
jgi:nucleoid-associated protein YgaU